MVLHLGVDGGGTGCRVAISDAQGQVLAMGSGRPSNINSDPDGALASILGAVRIALADAGQPPEAIRDLVAVLGLAGANVAASRARFEAALPFARFQIVSDARTTARGAIGEGDGILAAMGTGSVFALQRGEAFRIFGGCGFVLGDEGSGAVLGRALLARSLKAAQGFVPLTPLLAQVLEQEGGMDAIITRATHATPAEFARLAPLLSDSDDPAAREIWQAAEAEVDEILRAITVLAPDERLPVVVAGGLGPVWGTRLAARWPVRRAEGTALDGALALARALALRGPGGA